VFFSNLLLITLFFFPTVIWWYVSVGNLMSWIVWCAILFIIPYYIVGSKKTT
jgi:hypothetical protein